jgi:hypothetical protein
VTASEDASLASKHLTPKQKKIRELLTPPPSIRLPILKILYFLWLPTDCNVATIVSSRTVQTGDGSLLRAIRVHILALRRSDSLAAEFIRLIGIHTQDSGEGEQS